MAAVACPAISGAQSDGGVEALHIDARSRPHLQVKVLALIAILGLDSHHPAAAAPKGEGTGREPSSHWPSPCTCPALLLLLWMRKPSSASLTCAPLSTAEPCWRSGGLWSSWPGMPLDLCGYVGYVKDRRGEGRSQVNWFSFPCHEWPFNVSLSVH